MKIIVLSIFAGFLALGAEPPVKVELKNTAGKSVGTADVREATGNDKGVVIDLNLLDLPPGPHAVHIHQNPSCEQPSFESAGPHFNPHKKQHGLQNPQGPHVGDLLNIDVPSNGRAQATLRNALVTLGAGENSLFSNGGTALVIHAAADDMKSDPAGNAGGRIACGVIAKQNSTQGK